MEKSQILVKQFYWGACLLMLTVLFLFALDQARVHTIFENLVAAEKKLIAADLASVIENQASIGLAPELSAGTLGILERTMARHSGIMGVAVSGSNVAVLVTGVVKPSLLSRAIKEQRSDSRKTIKSGGTGAVARKLNLQMGDSRWVVVTFTLESAQEQSSIVLRKAMPTLIMSLLLSMTVLFIVLPYLVKNGTEYPDVMARQVAYVLGGLLLAVHFTVGFATYKTFQSIGDQYAEKIAEMSGREIKGVVEDAVSIGIPLNRTVGLSEWLGGKVSEPSRGISSIRIMGSDGIKHAEYVKSDTIALGSYEYQLTNNGEVFGSVVIGIDEAHVSNQSSLLYMEFTMLFIVGLVLIYECFVAFMKRAAITRSPVSDLRLSVFFFVFGIEMSRPGMPLVAMQFQPETPVGQSMSMQWITAASGWMNVKPEMFIAVMPMWAGIAVVALSSPLWGYLGARLGTRRVFYAAGLIGVASMVQGILIEDATALIYARVLGGLAFAAISVAALSSIVEDGKWSSGGVSYYFTTYVSAAMCGLGVGSLVTERMSYSATFAIGVVCVCISMIFVNWIPLEKSTSLQEEKASIGESVLGMLKHPNMILVFVLILVPLAVVQQGVIYIWLPLQMSENGESLVAFGFALMTYMAAAYITSMIVGARKDLKSSISDYVLFGQLAAAVGIIIGLFIQDIIGGVAMSALMGISWALTFSSLSAFGLNYGSDVLQKGLGASYIVGMYRGAERIALLLSPMLIILILDVTKDKSTLMYSLVLMLISIVIFLTFRKRLLITANIKSGATTGG